ncbi:MAG: ATP-binding protein [Pirellulales bacterium]|nr:ATP-binding protein [Pirellulales bacterium]
MYQLPVLKTFDSARLMGNGTDTRVVIPEQLESLLRGSDFSSPIHEYARQIGDILSDNKLQFFPDYTDHGLNHINRVLQTQVKLIEQRVWDDDVLTAADAAVIVGATLLHDLGMHLTKKGFLELVSQDSPFKPLRWFDSEQEGHAKDRPWPELWEDYQREARRFSEVKLANIIGTAQVESGWRFETLAPAGNWDDNHKLIVGEFIRRHHARMAHEFALYGFPGAEAEVPGLAGRIALGELADLIGLTARSHGMSLRVCKAYLDKHYRGTPRPRSTAVLFPMALLRVADYLQLERDRAPNVLLLLRDPQSPISVREWAKHAAVSSVQTGDDPRALMVEVNADIPLEIYLQLRELFDDLQREIDHSTAVLSEAYGARSDLKLDRLALKIRRVTSNLNDPVYRSHLPYVPEPTGFTADPNLLALLVKPLYGDEPSVGIRELIQNGVDAVLELHAWCEKHGVAFESLALAEQDCDVLVEYIEETDAELTVRVTDRGIGMTADTIANYFLRAGASFRNSDAWAREFTDEQGRSKVTRSGRFGIGAFATFLLGDTFTLQTRHVNDPGGGFRLTATKSSRLIEIERLPMNEQCPIGTVIAVKSPASAVEDAISRGVSSRRKADWYCWQWPSVVQRVHHLGGATETLDQATQMPGEQIPGKSDELPAAWNEVKHPDYDRIAWTFSLDAMLICNGMHIRRPDENSNLPWSRAIISETLHLNPTDIAVIDRQAKLPLTIPRYGLQGRLPFEAELARDLCFSLIAFALKHGPRKPPHCAVGGPRVRKHPQFISTGGSGTSPAPWCSSKSAFIPCDRWLIRNCGNHRVITYGSLRTDFYRSERTRWKLLQGNLLDSPDQENNWFAALDLGMVGRDITKDAVGWMESPGSFLAGSATGVQGIAVVASNNASVNHWDVQSLDLELGPDAKLLRAVTWNIGHLSEPIDLRPLMTEMYSHFREQLTDFGRFFRREKDFGLYITQCEIDHTVEEPRSLLGEVWEESLGLRPIPFDPEARAALVEIGRQHPELRRHIETWEKLAAEGSEWVPRDDEDNKDEAEEQQE